MLRGPWTVPARSVRSPCAPWSKAVPRFSARCSPDEPGGRRPEGHQAGLAGGDSLLQEGHDDIEEFLVGLVKDRLMDISAAVSRCTHSHPSLLPAGAAVLTRLGFPQCPTIRDQILRLHGGGRCLGCGRPRRATPSGRRDSAFRRTGRPGPRPGACRDRLGYRWPRMPTIKRTAAPSGTDGASHARGRASSRTRGSAAARSPADVMTPLSTSAASSSAVAEPPATGTLRSTRRAARGACGVGERSMLTEKGAHWS